MLKITVMIKKLNFLLERCLYADSLGQIMMAALNSIHVSFTCFFYTFTYTIFNQYIKQFLSLLMMTVPSSIQYY